MLMISASRLCIPSCRIRARSELTFSVGRRCRFSNSTLHTENTEHAEDDYLEPWKVLLELPARAAWRASSSRLPNALGASKQYMLQHAKISNKQRQKIHETVIAAHRKLAARRDRERKRVLKNMGYEQSEQKKDAAVQPVLYGPEEAMAFLQYRFHPQYAVVTRVLEETRSLLGADAFNPRRVIDFGIGCGSASAAALEVWESVDWIHGIDSSLTMREVSRMLFDEMLKQDDSVKVPRVTLSAHLPAESASEATFDLALFTYTATELPHSVSALAAAALLWEKLCPDGLFVMVEPGTPDGFSSIRTVRNMLLDAVSSRTDEVCQVIAPCTHNGKCPVERFQGSLSKGLKQQGSETGDQTGGEESSTLQLGFCSFVQTMASVGGLVSSEKFSYLVMQKQAPDRDSSSKSRLDGTGLVDLLKQHGRATSDDELLATYKQSAALAAHYSSFEDDLGLDFLQTSRDRRSFGRIVRSPMKKKGHVLIDMCVGPGRIVRQQVTKSMSKRAPGLYSAARKSRWGGFWPYLNEDESS